MVDPLIIVKMLMRPFSDLLPTNLPPPPPPTLLRQKIHFLSDRIRMNINLDCTVGAGT